MSEALRERFKGALRTESGLQRGADLHRGRELTWMRWSDVVDAGGSYWFCAAADLFVRLLLTVRRSWDFSESKV